MFEQFGLALTDNAVSDETWFRLLEFVFSQIQLLESPLRAAESQQWLDRFRKLVRDVHCTGKCVPAQYQCAQAEASMSRERANKHIRITALQYFSHREPAVMGPAVGEVVDGVVASFLPVAFALFFYKFDQVSAQAFAFNLIQGQRINVLLQIRLDVLYAHYYHLRGNFERFESDLGDGLVRTRLWILETLRPLCELRHHGAATGRVAFSDLYLCLPSMDSSLRLFVCYVRVTFV